MTDDTGLIRRLKDANRDPEETSLPPPPPPPRDGDFDGDSGDPSELQLGRQLAGIMKSRNYHPVIVVGSNGSGKTTFLASLLARPYANPHQSSVTFNLAEECLFPSDHPRYEEIKLQTARFYDGTVENFADWQVVAATRFEHPFYVPIELVPKDPRLPPLRLAFLEARGETFTPEIETDKTGSFETEFMTRKKLPDVITSVLVNFDRPITFIYAAPCAASGRSKQRKADATLSQGIEKIRAIRMPAGMSAKDRHLFLLSMWDEHTGGVSARAFRDPTQAQTDQVQMSHFPRAWPKFASQRSEGRQTQYFQLHYSVGPVAAGQLTQVASDARHVLNRFPRIVLNWLYTGATGEVLFHDVLPPPPPPWNILDWIIRLIRYGTARA